MKGDELVACVRAAHATLHRETDLSPRNRRINAALGALVDGVLAARSRGEAAAVLADPGLQALRGGLLEKLAVAEGEMERHWSERLSARAGLAAADLAGFVYWDCYRHLVEDELWCLPRLSGLTAGERISFVGAGALPLSAILMHVRTGIEVTCIDTDPHACRLARALCDRLGLAAIDVKCAHGADCDYERSRVVLVASLVPEKAEVVARVRQVSPAALIALRSAEGLSTLLYAPVDEPALEAMGCTLLGRTGYNPRAINTTLVYEPLSSPSARDLHIRKEAWIGMRNLNR
jgi:nicotianamine synthase-like protein